jgi:NitT/TauT family transport system substrate-binding protein
MNYIRHFAGAPIAAVAFVQSAAADELTIGQRDNRDTAISYVGDNASIFNKHGIQLKMMYTSGSGETLQPVISGSVDIVLAVGTLGAMTPARAFVSVRTGAAHYGTTVPAPPTTSMKVTPIVSTYAIF